MAEIKKIINVLENAGVIYKKFDFEGHCHGINVGGFPSQEGAYDTVGYGELIQYYKGDTHVDSWIKVYEDYVHGSPEHPSYYSTLYIKEHDLVKVESEIRKICR